MEKGWNTSTNKKSKRGMSKEKPPVQEHRERKRMSQTSQNERRSSRGNKNRSSLRDKMNQAIQHGKQIDNNSSNPN